MSAPPGERHLVDADGRPFLLVGDAAWSLAAQLDREGAERYLVDRRARGFNAVLVNVLERAFATNAPANIFGDPPFTTPDDYATPNESYFAHVDWIFARAERLGLLVLATPSYLGWDGGGEGWYQSMLANSVEALHGYGRFLGERYRGFDNIIWVDSGDYDPPNRDVVRAIAAGLKETAPHALHTVHCRLDTSGLDYWPNEEWLSINSIYTRGDVVSACRREYERPEGMPFFYFEGGYENESHDRDALDEQGLRRQAYHALLSGAFGHVFGNNPVWHFDGPGIFDTSTDWPDALDSRGAQSMTILRNLFAVAPWPLLQPDFDGVFLSSPGDVAATASDGSAAMAYVATRRPFTVDLGRLAGGAARVRWYDPSNGDWSEAAEAARSDVVTLSTPGRNAAGYRDWVLLAEAVSAAD